MIEPLSLFANPFAYFLLMFISIVLDLNAIALLTTTVIISVLAFPFLLLALKINERTRSKKQNKMQMLKTVFLTVIVFWVVSRIIYTLNGHPFISASLLGILASLVLMTAVAFPFVITGQKINKAIKSKYSIPYYLNLYIVCLITSFLFSLFIVIMVVLNYYKILFGVA